MTERARTVAAPPPRTVALGTLVAIAAILLFLVGQMRAGRDPLLKVAAAPAHRRVVVRRVYERVVVVRVRKGSRPVGTSVSSSSSSTSGPSYSPAPVTTGSS